MSLYAHLSEFKVELGEIVKSGQLIGLSGESGNANSLDTEKDDTLENGLKLVIPNY